MSDYNYISIDGGDVRLEGREATLLLAVLEYWVQEKPEGFYRLGDNLYAHDIYRKLSLRGEGLIPEADNQ